VHSQTDMFVERYEQDMVTIKEVIAWQVVFEDGSVELHTADSIDGEPDFGRWVTPMVAGTNAIDLDPQGN